MQENNLKITGNEVHIWQASLQQSDEAYRALEATLSPDEIARADRFKFPHDRRHYVIGRGILRNLLGRYRSTDAASLRFKYSAYGKPALPDEEKDSLYFNLSHSAEQALFAFAHHPDLGIDLEFMRENIEVDEIAERFFSRDEVDYIMARPPSEHRRLFFTCWTRKEAFIKAVGSGLSFPLASFTVDLTGDDDTGLLKTEWDEAERFEWILRNIEVAGKYRAALAVRCKDATVRRYNWIDK